MIGLTLPVHVYPNNMLIAATKVNNFEQQNLTENGSH